jgi:hypothetical protein
MRGDRRPLALVVRSKLTLIVMVPPRPGRGWGERGLDMAEVGGDSATRGTPGTDKGGLGAERRRRQLMPEQI